MRQFKEKRFFKKIIFSWPMIMVLGFFVVYLGASVFKTYLKTRKVTMKNTEINKQIEDLNLKKNELESTLERLKTSAGAEEELHKKFQIQKPGEELLVIVEEPEESAAVGRKGGVGGFFRSIWSSIKSIFE